MNNKKAIVVIGLAACCLMLVFSGCSEKGTGDRLPNIVPDTFISFGPKEDSLTYFKVQAFWYGADDDGDIERFEVATVKNINRSMFGGIDPDSLTWIATTSKESTFVLAADSCCLYEQPKADPNYALSAWGILVRSVDDQGDVDPSPASLFFKASNVIPKAKVNVPARTGGQRALVSPFVYLEWEGDDPDGDAGGLMYKYITAVTYKDDQWPALPPLSQEEAPGGHASPPPGVWSEWVPPDCTSVTDLDLTEFVHSLQDPKWVALIVTCKDEGGAYLPEPLFATYNKKDNGVIVTIVENPDLVNIRIDAGSLGIRKSEKKPEYENLVAGLFSGSTVSFKIEPFETKSYGRVIEAYRYYYDLPDDPATSTWNFWTSPDPLRRPGFHPEWFFRFPADGVITPGIGPHVFVVEMRDLNQQTSHCEFRFEVLTGPRGRDPNILLVDDNLGWGAMEEPRYGLYEQGEDSLWAEIMDGYEWECIDTGRNFKVNEVSVRRVGIATTVIWNCDTGFTGSPVTKPYLTTVCTELGNYLGSYVKVGGNLIIIGTEPIYSHAYWPDGETPDPTRVEVWPGQLDFRPEFDDVDSSWTYNFNWEIFGIEKMGVATPAVAFSVLWPCDDRWPGSAPLDAIQARPALGTWTGEVGNIYFVQQVREDLDVHTLYGIVPTRGGEEEPTCEYLAAVYVPGDGERGHAAYIAVNAWFFDHDRMKALIRSLLELFGEYPKES